MTYLALPHRTATWLLDCPNIVRVLAQIIANNELAALRERDFYVSPVRLTADDDLIAFINSNHSSGVGDDWMGFVRIAGYYSIASYQEAASETLQSAIRIIHTRFSDQQFDPDTIRYSARGEHHHVATWTPRETVRDQLFLGWIERTFRAAGGSATYRSLLLCGPDADGRGASDAAQQEHPKLEGLVSSARALIGRDLRPLLDETQLDPLRRAILQRYRQAQERRTHTITALSRKPEVSPEDFYRTDAWTYRQWSDPASTLTEEQRAVLESDALHEHPLRLVGPAGTGKTLLMQLMAMRELVRPDAPRVLYLTHNTAMEDRVRQRFMVLGGFDDGYLAAISGRLKITTLAAFAADKLGLEVSYMLDKDPETSKDMAFEYLKRAIDEALTANGAVVEASDALRTLATPDKRRYLNELVRAEVTGTIKGRGTSFKRTDYMYAPPELGLLLKVLNAAERAVVFDAYERYVQALDEYGLMDADDVALEMLSSLTQRKWQIDRKDNGFDFIFVDEAQLFNFNEYKIFALLSNGRQHHSPVAIALDPSQRLFDIKQAGLAFFGLDDAQQMTLHLGHRLAEDIARLAFFVLAESTAFFGEDFPAEPKDFLDEGERLGKPRLPQLIVVPHDRLGRRINRLVRLMRKEGHRQIAIIAHNAAAFDYLSAPEQLPMHMQDLNFSVLHQRGAWKSAAHPYVMLSRPELIGGQEVDAVICCGLEEGVVPPKVPGNALLEFTLLQQSLREMYLAFTRARHQLFIVNTAGSSPSATLQRAINANRLELIEEA